MSYEKYFKDVSGYDVIDVYRTHRIFGLNDEVLCHASKKLLLSGVRTGGKSLEQDVKEARDSLNRWLEMLAEDFGNAQEEVEWPDESRIDVIGQNGNDGAAYSEYPLEEVLGDASLRDWAAAVVVDKDGGVCEYNTKPSVNFIETQWFNPEGSFKRINKVAPPLNFKNCIWVIKK